MNASARDKIFKSWSGVSEVQLIKEVATKGEYVDLCIEYWAKKRKLPQLEYKLFFHDVVQTYVNRLLTERLVCKAETVLRNVQRNVRCFYYQFACECEDEELRELVMEHLRRKEPHSFDQDMQDLKFYWELLQELQRCPELLERYKADLRRINLETLLGRDETYRKRLMVELYCEQRNPAILVRLNKFIIWDFLVERQNLKQLVRWCTLSGQCSTAASEYASDLEVLYSQWPIETEMFEHALKALKQPNESLKNCFAKEGYFFDEERLQVSTVLRRLCTTNSFEQNKEILGKLPLGEWILKRGYVMLLLHDFVSTRELEELAEVFPTQRNLLEFIVAVKSNPIEERAGFEKITASTKSYLESQGVDFETTQPFATFYEFLCNEPTVSALNCFLLSSALKCIPYLNALARRLDNGSPLDAANLPTPYDMLRKFKNLDFKLIVCKDSNDIASFSNQRLCQKYARKYHLNFLHYLNQQRSCFAVYYLLTDYLKQYAQITKNQLFSATETVTELALQHPDNSELLTHCIAFNEMLGFDTQNLRTFLKLYRQLDVKDFLPNFSQLIERVEVKLVARLAQDPSHFPLAEYQALMRVVACNQFRQWPELILQHYAKSNDWRQLLLIMQYFDIPLKQMQRLVQYFGKRTVGEHLLRALSHEPGPVTNERNVKRMNSSYSRQQKQSRKPDNMPPTTTSAETMTSSISSCNDANTYFKSSNNNQVRFLLDSSGNLDLFAIILLSTNSIPEERITDAARFHELMQDNHSYATSLNLMKNSIKFKQPVLALLSATVTPLNIDWNWVVWLAVATDQWSEVLAICLKDVTQLTWTLIENCLRRDNIGTLHRSICIFFENNPLTYFTRFLQETSQNNSFGDDVINDLRLYLLAWSNDEVVVPHCPSLKREDLMLRTIHLLLIHLQAGFSSAYEQSKLLQCICQSGISDISNLLDFCLLNQVFGILQSSSANRCSLPFDQLIQNDGKAAYDQLIQALLESKEYDLAIQLATLLHMPISDIVYIKWVAGVDSSSLHDLSFQCYEDEIRTHSLPPELLVNFFLYASMRLEEPCARKYMLLKRALTVIKQNHLFPNESFDRDQIEYDRVLCYLQIADAEELDKLELYYSEYFEEIMLKERCVLYKSFLELKELAGIEDLTTSLKVELTVPMKLRLEVLLNRLLDEGDIVEALRLQELFEHRPVDLRFVVFCMALAEGVTTIFSMSSEERQLLREVEKSAFSKFNKRTLDTLRSSGSHQGQSSPFKQNNELSDSCSTLEFEEIPSKEKRETLETIQGIASRLQNGINIGTRIVKAYRAAMYLDKEYLDVLRTKDTAVLLRSVAEDGCLHKLLVVSDITTSTHMTAAEIAELLAFEITTAIVRPRFYIFSADQQAKSTFKNADLWGYNIDRDLHLFLELTPHTTILGNWLLEFCDALKVYRKFQAGKIFERSTAFDKLRDIIERYGLPAEEVLTTGASSTSQTTTPATPSQVLSHKKQNIICVELLIKAHQCFVHECSMEGIANVLNRAKALNSILTQAKSWSLIVRMLIGIARYREMFYCFDALIENEQFESLLGQFDVEKTVVLRQAIIAYLREYCPENGREYLKLAALHFLMYKELAEMWEQEAHVLVDKVLSLSLLSTAQLTEQNSMTSLCGSGGGGAAKICIPKLKICTDLITYLQQAMENYTHATENYLLDNKLLLAQRSASQAELMAMQIDLASKLQDKNLTTVPHLCVCVINVQTRDDFRELINAELRVPQAMILSRAYGYDINWSEVLLSQFIILTKKSYLNDYLAHFAISDNMIENIIKGFQLYAQTHKTNQHMEEHMVQLVAFVKSITLKYKLASILNMKSTVMSLISEQTLYYLKDTNYGRNESQSMPDV